MFSRVRQAAPFAELSRRAFEGVLDMLSGRYPSDEFAELRPRITWDRVQGIVTGRSGAKRVAIANAGTIPDRGLYGVFLAGADRPVRVGELGAAAASRADHVNGDRGGNGLTRRNGATEDERRRHAGDASRGLDRAARNHKPTSITEGEFARRSIRRPA